LQDLGWDEKRRATNQDIYDLLVNRKAELKDISPPGTHYTYCNTNYVLLALLVEKLSGTSFPAFIKTQFFDRLQMKNSFVYTPSDSARATPNYDGRGPIANSYMDNVYGDKNVYTTPRDLLIWHRALSSKLLFTDSTLLQAYAPYSNERPGIKNYGLGWHLNIFPNGKKIIFHNGWWHGNTAAFVRLPDEDMVIIVLGNRSNRTVWKAIRLANSFGEYFGVPEPEE
jgi:CubicO group peptidase (beta-lactamase class C family)